MLGERWRFNTHDGPPDSDADAAGGDWLSSGGAARWRSRWKGETKAEERAGHSGGSDEKASETARAGLRHADSDGDSDAQWEWDSGRGRGAGAPEGTRGWQGGDGVALSEVENGMRNVNVLPTPSLLRTCMLPDISDNKCREIGRPSPTPPARCLPIWTNWSKIFETELAGMPGPVSVAWNTTVVRTSSSSSRNVDTFSTTCP
mmetsp:Transcript_5878/g.10085  ORF Transcript_5878/g.10085 Transcript_5878/m.10085 type:complete len:203 (+) Transcript_5878:1104-1712(+)